MEKNLLKPEVQKFIAQNTHADLAGIILKGSPFSEISIQEIAEQIEGRQKAEKKLPTWHRTKNILYPKKLNLEQTSSEITAKYKADLVQGQSLIDLTGGFGVDAFFFSKTIKTITHCELNPKLSEMAEHNFALLSKKNNIRFVRGNGLDFLQKTRQTYDWIYLDPSRRSETGKKVFRLEDAQPKVTEILPLLMGKARNIMLKTSPLLDLSRGLSILKSVSEIHIVAVGNEVKELIWIISSVGAPNETCIKTINFKSGREERFNGAFEAEKHKKARFSAPKSYLYEPNAALMKSGLFNTLAETTQCAKLHPNSHLYTAENQIDFPGRIFKIQKILPFKPKVLKKEIPTKKANISTRNFPKTVAQLKKQFEFEDGGNIYLFFTTNYKAEKIVLVCTK